MTFIASQEDEYVEQAILVGIDRGSQEWSVEESLEELSRLTETAGAVCIATVSQKLKSPNPRTLIGEGKAKEIAEMVKALQADVVIFDDELTPSQQSNLEKIMRDAKVIDRTALILDIFALHAQTREGRLQVRLAQNIYLLPRLRGMWAHLASNRMGGGVGSRFGEGESQLEVDRRIVRKRILSIRRELDELSKTRSLQRRSRQSSGVFRVSLAGYTNAGKSSLLNRLTGADVLAYDKLFATLDSTTRKLRLTDGTLITLTDTVGFIQKLPTTLVESFKSTLDEIREADLILVVADCSDSQFEAQIQAVNDTLQSIHSEEIPRILVLNKIDLLTKEELVALSNRYPLASFVSAVEGEGCEILLERIAKVSAAQGVLMSVTIPYTRGDLVQIAHERCGIVEENFLETGTMLEMRVPQELAAKFNSFSNNSDTVEE